jgi:hypothetical protein
MALNLNKGGEENSKPSTEKKGLNLSKSEDPAKTGLNLSKEETVSKETTSFKSGANETSPKKKNPVFFILLAVLLVGGGLFWFINKGTTTPEKASNMNGDNTVSACTCIRLRRLHHLIILQIIKVKLIQLAPQLIPAPITLYQALQKVTSQLLQIM